MAEADRLPEVAFYYPGTRWRNADYIKNLLLFFDGVALLVPDYMVGRPVGEESAVAAGLEEEGLLHILEPEKVVDQGAAEGLAGQLGEILDSGALDHLAFDSDPYEALSASRMGSYADEGLAGTLVRKLLDKDLARPSEDGVSIPMHPLIRNLVLVLLSQLLRPSGRKQGLDLCPATDTPELHSSLAELLGLETLPSAAHVIDLDLQVVGVDMASVGLDELLAFREAHSAEYRAYARDVRRYMRELAPLSGDERSVAEDDRAAEISERARHLQKVAKGWWKRPAGVLMGLSGAAWTATTGDPLGGLIGGATGLATAAQGSPKEVEAFSYLFRSANSFYW